MIAASGTSVAAAPSGRATWGWGCCASRKLNDTPTGWLDKCVDPSGRSTDTHHNMYALHMLHEEQNDTITPSEVEGTSASEGKLVSFSSSSGRTRNAKAQAHRVSVEDLTPLWLFQPAKSFVPAVISTCNNCTTSSSKAQHHTNLDPPSPECVKDISSYFKDYAYL